MYLRESQKEMGQDKSQLLNEILALHGQILIDWLEEAKKMQKAEFIGIDVNSDTLKTDILKAQVSVACLDEFINLISKTKEKYNAN